MKLQNYIKTKDTKTIQKFIKLCKEHNIPIDSDIQELLESETKIYGVGVFIKEPTITNIVEDIDISVCLITEEPASWWNKLSHYEHFIKTFDKNEIINFLNDKLKQTKNTFPQFTIGCEMVSDIDLEYGFYKNDWVPYILKSYCYCSVTNEWVPRTQRGWGFFNGFRIWTKDIPNMNKKQIKNLLK